MRALSPIAAVCLTLSLAVAAWPATGTIHTVTTTADSGAGSLRNAIQAANLTPDADVIRFDASLSGQTIYPLTQLPAVVDGATTIDGDINDDGRPDIALCGSKQASGDGLTLNSHPDGNGCTVQGLAIFSFPEHGLVINDSDDNHVRTCHLGVNLPGGVLKANGQYDIYIFGGQDNLVGGSTGMERNVIAGGNGAVSGTAGVKIDGGQNNRVQRNYFGLKRSGSAVLGLGRTGVSIDGGTGNTVGGSGAATRNVFGGLTTGVSMAFGATSNTVSGNYVGMTAGGGASLPLTYGVVIGSDASGNVVGGTSAGLRNVFAGGDAADGIYILNAGANGNTILGNYFGLTPNGKAQLGIDCGVYVGSGAGSQTIGGGSAKAANHFCCMGEGVVLRFGGAGTVIRQNKFGIRGDGTPATGLDLCSGMKIDDVSAIVTENTIRGLLTGLGTEGAANPRVTKNSFADCTHAVHASETSAPNLGNLGNTSTGDDGGNVFATSNAWTVYNQTANLIRAEGNDWGTTVASQINTRIYDRKDNASYGRVDFDPLIGGVSPTGDAGAAVALTAASATPTASGAEIAFTLSAPADLTVEVLNIAGRPVATVVAGKSADTGLQRLAWNGTSSQGLRAPNGMYVVRITVRDPKGAQTQALVPLRLQRR